MAEVVKEDQMPVSSRMAVPSGDRRRQRGGSGEGRRQRKRRSGEAGLAEDQSWNPITLLACRRRK
jgi:hypothetical protein